VTDTSLNDGVVKCVTDWALALHDLRSAVMIAVRLSWRSGDTIIGHCTGVHYLADCSGATANTGSKLDTLAFSR